MSKVNKLVTFYVTLAYVSFGGQGPLSCCSPIKEEVAYFSNFDKDTFVKLNALIWFQRYREFIYWNPEIVLRITITAYIY